MIIDSHIHVWSFPVLEQIGDKIQTATDLMLFRSRYPELYAWRLTEQPVDNSDALVEQMDKAGVDIGIVQATPGGGTVSPIPIADQVARGLAPRKRLRDLVCDPFRSRVYRCSRSSVGSTPAVRHRLAAASEGVDFQRQYRRKPARCQRTRVSDCKC